MAESFDHSPRDLYITGVTVAKTRDSKGLIKEKEIDRGAYGAVLELSWQGTSCAGKRIHPLIASDKCVQDFQRECTTWSKLRHPYVAQFLGLYSELRSAYPIIVMEKVDTSLSHLLEKRGRVNCPLGLKVRLLHHVALGLVYLHGRRPMVIHRDLHPKNILIDLASMTAKLADFGVAKILNSSQQLTANPGHPYFMPPEVDQKQDALPELGNHDRIDVFSFGGVVIMTMTHDWPAPTSATVTQDGKLYPVTEYERRNKWVEAFTDEQQCFLPLVKRCLENEPSKRPTSADLAAEIAQMKVTRLQLRKPSAFHQYDLEKNLEDAQRELKESQEKLTEANSEVQQLTDCMLQKKKESEVTTRRLQSELIEAQSYAKKLSNDVHTATEHIRTLRAEQEKLEKELQAKGEELKEAQVQLRDLRSELTILSKENKHLKESLNFKQSVSTSFTPDDENDIGSRSRRIKRRSRNGDEMEHHYKKIQSDLEDLQTRSRQTVKPESSQDDVLLMNAFERIQTKGAQCHSDVKDQLHALQVAMDKATVDAVSSKSPFESKAKEKPSSVDFHACARLCSVLQGCYDRCVDTLKAESTETVRLFWDESSRWFAKEVIDCMNHAFDTELSCANSKGSSGDSSSCPQMEEQARRFIVAVTKVTESKQALSLSDAKKYKALHALVMAYLDGERGSLKQQEILQAMLFDNQELESFLKTIVPICWKLATIYMPPIFVCAQGGQTFNDCYHERHPKSHDSETTIKCCIFPLVLRDYRGQIRKKAVVLT